MIIKATILRSNPHILREIYLENNKTMKEFFRVLEICLNRERNMIPEDSLILSYGARDKNQDSGQDKNEMLIVDIMDQTCEEFFRLYPMSCLFLPMADSSERDGSWNQRIFSSYSMRNRQNTKKERENWEILLISLPDEAERKEKAEAELLRHRGLQPIWQASTMKENNWIHQSMLEREYTYLYGLGEFQRMDYEVSLKAIARSLGKPKQSRRRLKVKQNICWDIRQILNQKKLDELKYAIREKRLPIDINGRKNILIDRMEHYYDRVEFWEKLAEEMRLEEYQLMKELCFSENAEYPDRIRERFPSLQRYGLFHHSSQAPVIFPGPFVKYLEAHLAEEGDEGLIYRKKWQQVLRVASELYLIFDKKMCLDLAKIMYPGELDPQDISQVWESGESWANYHSLIMYHSDYIYFKDAYELYQNPEWQKRKTYLPDPETIAEILTEGLNYEKEDRQRLADALKTLLPAYYWLDDHSGILRYIYHLCRCNVDTESILEELKDILGIRGTKEEIEDFLCLMEELRGRVRKLEYRGYTQEEYEAYYGKE